MDRCQIPVNPTKKTELQNEQVRIKAEIQRLCQNNPFLIFSIKDTDMQEFAASLSPKYYRKSK